MEIRLDLQHTHTYALHCRGREKTLVATSVALMCIRMAPGDVSVFKAFTAYSTSTSDNGFPNILICSLCILGVVTLFKNSLILFIEGLDEYNSFKNIEYIQFLEWMQY